MKSRAFWLFVLTTALALTALVLWRRPTPGAQPDASGRPTAQSTTKAKSEVPIQDGKTIDFSSGVPLVKDDTKEKAALERSLKAMEEAVKNVTFTSPVAARVPAAGDQKKTEPPPAPSKP